MPPRKIIRVDVDAFDDGGETLGLGDGGIDFYRGKRRDFEDAKQVADAMRVAAEFFHDPSLCISAVGEVTTGIMRTVDEGWAALPQPWAHAYCCVVAACLCERIGVDSGQFEDGFPNATMPAWAPRVFVADARRIANATLDRDSFAITLEGDTHV